VITLNAADLAGAAYAGFFEDLSPYGSYVVWLYDLTPGELVLLTPEVLDIVTTYSAITATVCARWCALFEKDTDDTTADARTLLVERANRVSIPSGAQPGQLDPVVSAVVANAARKGDHLLSHFQQGASQNPVGQELAQAAIDVRRAGVHRGLFPHELRALLAHGRASRESGQLARSRSLTTFHDAMTWASGASRRSTTGLLAKRDDGSWSAVNYLAAAQDGGTDEPVRAIPHARWTMMIDKLLPVDAFHIGVAAHLRGLPRIRDAAYRTASRCHDTVVAAAAERAY
jgi:hypothetical protein